MDRRPCGRRPLGGGVAGPRRRRGARRALDTPGRGIAALQFGDRALGRDRGARSGRREEPQVQQDRVTPPPQDRGSSSRTYFERSEEHTSELQPPMRNPDAVLCVKKNKHTCVTTEI